MTLLARSLGAVILKILMAGDAEVSTPRHTLDWGIRVTART